ncbi:hypothetical protein VNO77_09384 [Canavalia gladiata]|uniref:Uncharacterized protein n=1 Tax=Canavalia gladiata TaxID=3824 RepID=A0AAN9MCZ6_CANGL
MCIRSFFHHSRCTLSDDNVDWLITNLCFRSEKHGNMFNQGSCLWLGVEQGRLSVAWKESDHCHFLKRTTLVDLMH